ncbi:hypothetical protein [uncultured Fusobacterium sp.]|uniref:hypothetical protein n=1 Tax=uncultured Fusobacterium sp. TaxID=159267 RepID=UPI0025E83488|nr:hypothetical protein [uncultured Fusobacterium sp.]
MGKIKVAPNYSIVMGDKKYLQGETIEVEDTRKFENKKYAFVIEKSVPSEEKEDEVIEETPIPEEEEKNLEEETPAIPKGKKGAGTKKGSKAE